MRIKEPADAIISTKTTPMDNIWFRVKKGCVYEMIFNFELDASIKIYRAKLTCISEYTLGFVSVGGCEYKVDTRFDCTFRYFERYCESIRMIDDIKDIWQRLHDKLKINIENHD